MLDQTSATRSRTLFLCATVAVLIGNIYVRGLVAQKPSVNTRDNRKPYDTGGKIPGNAALTSRSLQQLYGVIRIYRTRHLGQYPLHLHELEVEASEGSVYPVNLTSLKSSDCRFSDSTATRAEATGYPFVLSYSRPNGTLIGSKPKDGHRDVLAYSALYARQNIRYDQQSRRYEANPIGFYLVLWDNGAVTRVPFDERLFVPNGDSWEIAFPGQAGVPKEAKGFREWHESRSSFLNYPAKNLLSSEEESHG
jgi:hypothetical protein